MISSERASNTVLRSTSSMVTAKRAQAGLPTDHRNILSLFLPPTAQHAALQAEVLRRRDECIQLKAVLLEQSQVMKSINPESNDINVLGEALQAQKLINRWVT